MHMLLCEVRLHEAGRGSDTGEPLIRESGGPTVEEGIHSVWGRLRDVG